MSPELKALWLNALRSGEYRQTTGTLKDTDGYCCLGVLCHVASEAGMIPSDMTIVEDANRLEAALITDDGSWSDCKELEEGSFGLSGHIIMECMERNDGTSEDVDRQDFVAIADWLEDALAEEAR